MARISPALAAVPRRFAVSIVHRQWCAIGQRPSEALRPMRRVLALLSVLVVLNLSVGTPLICYLHCLALMVKAPGGDNAHHHALMTASQFSTVTQAEAADLPKSEAIIASPALAPQPTPGSQTNVHCPGGLPSSPAPVISATHEAASLSIAASAAPSAFLELLPTPEAAPASLHLPPLRRPPMSSVRS